MKKFQQTREVVNYGLKYIKGKTLDLGAGRAKYKDIIKRAASEYVASDKFGRDNIDVVCDLESTPFTDNYFETIVCTQVLEHLQNPWSAAREMGRILKPGGIALITAPFMTAYHEDPEDYFRYTPSGLETIFCKNNFETIEKGYYGRRFTVIAQFIEFIYFNPYKKRGKFSIKFVRLIYLLTNLLDRFVKNEIAYANVYLIAKKSKL